MPSRISLMWIPVPSAMSQRVAASSKTIMPSAASKSQRLTPMPGSNHCSERENLCRIRVYAARARSRASKATSNRGSSAKRCISRRAM